MAFSVIKPLRRHYNADIVSKTSHSFEEHVSQSGICSICSRCASCEIGLKAKTGSTVFPQPFGTMQFGAEKRLPNIEDLQIIPELFGNGVFFTEAKTEVVLGGFRLRAPVVAPALGSTDVAHRHGPDLAEGCGAAGIAMVIGENVLAPHGPKGLKARMQPFLKNKSKKFGALIVQGNVHDIQHKVFEKALELGADGIEIKLGQGAKQGLGGEIAFSEPNLAARYKKLGYRVLKRGKEFQRHALPGNLTEESLTSTILKYAELEVPMWAKVGIGNGIIKLVDLLDKIKRENGVKFECLTVDGFGGGTGMSPWLLMNEASLPSAALFGVLDSKPDFDLVLAGGYCDGFDAAKALMLGASGVAMGRAFLIASNALPEKKGTGIENFLDAIIEELQIVCATQRVETVQELKNKRKNLFALTKEASDLFGITSNPAKVL